MIIRFILSFECGLSDIDLRELCNTADGFNYSSAKAEEMIMASLRAGAKGGKITGSGNGGCIILYAPNHQAEVANAIKNCGGRAYLVQIDEGVREED